MRICYSCILTVLLLFAATILAPMQALACNGNYFHVENFTGISPGNFGQLHPLVGDHSLWCGVRASQSGYPTDGYGNNWDECWESCFIPFDLTDTTTTITVWYWISYHTEPKDSIFFESYDGSLWTTQKTYAGGPGGLQDMVNISAPLSGTIKLRFRMTSDASSSDEDFFDTDGAAIIDNIQVIANNQYINYEDFEGDAPGSQRTWDGVWVAGPSSTCLDSIPPIYFYNFECDTTCIPAAGLYPDTVSFEDMTAGASVEGLGVVDPLLDIESMINLNYSSCVPGSERVLKEGNTSPFWAYKSGTSYYNACFSGSQAMGDPNICVLDYQFTFAPGMKVHCFSIRMLDFGDYFPFGSGLHQVSLTAYDGSNSQVDQDVLAFTGNPLPVQGDACLAAEGQPGNYLFRVQGAGIKRVTLTFDSDPDSRVGFDDIVFCGSYDSIPCTPAPVGLRGWWKGDQDELDASAFANHGSFVNVASYAYFPKVGSGAFTFNGSNHVKVPDDPSLNFGIASSAGVGDFSIDAWVLLPDITGRHPIVTKKPAYMGFAPGYGFFVTDGALQLWLMSASYILNCFASTGPVVSPGQWTHVAVTVDRTLHKARFYVNGQLVGTNSIQSYCSGNIDNTYDLLIGAEMPSNYFIGDMDEVELLARVLTPTEINDIYMADYAGKCQPDSFGTGGTSDCNVNGIPDQEDISNRILHDQDGNEVPDECENKPCYAEDVDLIDFGAVAPGDTATRSFYLRNVCGGVLSGSASENCPDFELSNGAGTYNLAAGESLLVTALFVPSSEGSTQCTISTGFGPGILCLGIGQTTVATLVQSYEAQWDRDHVVIRWTISVPDEKIGFEILRSEDGANNFISLNAEAIQQNGKEFLLTDDHTYPGTRYAYRLTPLEDGKALGSMETFVATPIPKLALYQNHPNPFKEKTEISFSLDRSERVELSIYDITGRRVRVLLGKPLEAGWHRESWDGLDAQGKPVASGIYIYRLSTPGKAITRKAVLMR